MCMRIYVESKVIGSKFNGKYPVSSCFWEETLPRTYLWHCARFEGYYIVPDESTVANLCYEDLPSKKETLEPAYLPQCPSSVEIKGQEVKKVYKVLGKAGKNVTLVG